jgi:hypothetical protein
MDIQQVNSAALKAAGVYAGNRTLQKAVAPAQDEQMQPEARETREQPRLTTAEKDFFAEAFPSAAGDIRQHVMYQRDGIHQPSSLGHVLDRKG